MNNITISEARITLGALLRKPYEALQTQVYAGLAARGFADIRPAHSSVFRYIKPEGSRVSDLAERAEITKQSLAYVAGNLADLGYVSIEPDATDARAKLVILTERGRRVSEALVELSAGLEAQCATRMGAEKLGQLRAILAELAVAMTD
ncbi:MAG TPA: MarR family transcriptional regulator [Asticcacaulis sp.]|nr:MarR family transcriptional regulator [Asticcacaulis sp.]